MSLKIQKLTVNIYYGEKKQNEKQQTYGVKVNPMPSDGLNRGEQCYAKDQKYGWIKGIYLGFKDGYHRVVLDGTYEIVPYSYVKRVKNED